MILDMGIGECLCSLIHERKKGGTWIRSIKHHAQSLVSIGIQGVTPTTPLLKGAEKPQISSTFTGLVGQI